MTTHTDKLISDMRAIRDGILGRGVMAVEQDRVTLTFTRFSGQITEDNPSLWDGSVSKTTTERHVVIASLTASNDGMTTTSNSPTVAEIIDALKTFLTRAEQNDATELDLLSDVYHALSY